MKLRFKDIIYTIEHTSKLGINNALGSGHRPRSLSYLYIAAQE